MLKAHNLDPQLRPLHLTAAKILLAPAEVSPPSTEPALDTTTNEEPLTVQPDTIEVPDEVPETILDQDINAAYTANKQAREILNCLH